MLSFSVSNSSEEHERLFQVFRPEILRQLKDQHSLSMMMISLMDKVGEGAMPMREFAAVVKMVGITGALLKGLAARDFLVIKHKQPEWVVPEQELRTAIEAIYMGHETTHEAYNDFLEVFVKRPAATPSIKIILDEIAEAIAQTTERLERYSKANGLM